MNSYKESTKGQKNQNQEHGQDKKKFRVLKIFSGPDDDYDDDDDDDDNNNNNNIRLVVRKFFAE